MPILRKSWKPSKQPAWLFKVNTLKSTLHSHALQYLMRALAIIVLLGAGVVKNSALAEQHCQLQLSEPNIDHGEFVRERPTQAQHSTGLMPVGKRTVYLSAICAVDSVIGLSFNGEKSSELGYRFAKGGQFTLKVIEARLDDKPVRLRPLNRADAATSGRLIRPGGQLVAYEGPQLAAGKHLSVQIEVDTMIDIAGTRVSQDEEWEGSGHFELHLVQTP
jgi:hypothetical protein